MDTVRSALQPVTHSLPGPIRDLGISFLGETCYKTLVLDIDHTASECIKLGISKFLGIGIVAGSATVKLPQILKLVSSQSADGISFLAYLLETSSFLIGLAYSYRQGFPFSTYGENALIMAQNVVISVLVLQYGGKSSAAAAFVAVLAASAFALFNHDLIDAHILSYLQIFAGVLGVGSKLPQIYAIWQEGGTGQLSAFAVFNYLAGSLSRIFTTLQEVDDKMILYGFLAGFALNAIIAAQMVYYWNAPSRKAKGKQRDVPIVTSSASSTATPKGKSPSTRRRG